MKRIPFKIDRNRAENIPEQLANGFRQAILDGYYQPGEHLPTFDRIVAELGVSIRAPRDAVRILAKANLVRPRPRIGCVVLGRNERIWKGRILGVFLAAAEGSYYLSMMLGALRRDLVEHGYLFVPVAVETLAGGELDFSHLDALAAEKTDFIVAIYPNDAIARHVSKMAVPAVAYVDVQRAPGLEAVRLRRGDGLLIESGRLAAAGIRKILAVCYADTPNLRALRKKGLSVECLRVNVPTGTGYLEAIKRQAMEKLTARLESKKPLPDLIYFGDDFVAFGGLLALALKGVRVPEDVRVISLVNRGFAPVWPVSVARFEIDPQEDGRTLANQVLARLECRKPSASFLPCMFHDGVTFGESGNQLFDNTNKENT